MGTIKTNDERNIFLQNSFGLKNDGPQSLPGEDFVTSYLPTRMHRKQKEEFRKILEILAKEWGYDFNVESNFFAKNCVIGKPDKARVLVGAHYDTPPRMPSCVINHQFASFLIGIPAVVFALGYATPTALLKLSQNGLENPNLVNQVRFLQSLAGVLPVGLIAYMEGLFGNANKKNFNDNSSGVLGVLSLMYKYKDLPQKEKNKLAFVMFDNEEKGLFGSISYRIKHRKFISKQHMVNLDCLNGSEVNVYTHGESKKFVSGVKNHLTKSGIKMHQKKISFFKMSDHFPFFGAKSTTGIINDVKNVHSVNDDQLDRKHFPKIMEGIGAGVERLSGINLTQKKKEAKTKSITDFSNDELITAIETARTEKLKCSNELQIIEKKLSELAKNQGLTIVLSEAELQKKKNELLELQKNTKNEFRKTASVLLAVENEAKRRVNEMKMMEQTHIV